MCHSPDLRSVIIPEKGSRALRHNCDSFAKILGNLLLNPAAAAVQNEAFGALPTETQRQSTALKGNKLYPAAVFLNAGSKSFLNYNPSSCSSVFRAATENEEKACRPRCCIAL